MNYCLRTVCREHINKSCQIIDSDKPRKNFEMKIFQGGDFQIYNNLNIVLKVNDNNFYYLASLNSTLSLSLSPSLSISLNLSLSPSLSPSPSPPHLSLSLPPFTSLYQQELSGGGKSAPPVAVFSRSTLARDRQWLFPTSTCPFFLSRQLNTSIHNVTHVSFHKIRPVHQVCAHAYGNACYARLCLAAKQFDQKKFI